MKKTLLIILLLAAGIIACKKSGPLLYNTSSLSSVYFDFIDSTDMADSITYTFALTPGKTVDTIYIPVRISGVRMNKDRPIWRSSEASCWLAAGWERPRRSAPALTDPAR